MITLLFGKEARLDGYTLLTILVTIVVVLILDRLYLSRKSTSSGATGKAKGSYREEAFAEIIKINEDTIQHGTLDALTGLPGRQIYDERLRRILAYNKDDHMIFSVMIMNIDEFTNINNVYGNLFGNKLLVEVANRLRTVLRQIDTVSRYAGDSFFFIMPELSNPDIAILVAQRIQDSVIQPFIIENQRLFVTASIGIAIYSADEKNPEKLLKHAEDALKKAKLSGRNTYRIHNQAESKLSKEDANLKAYFMSASLQDKLIMYYQPYVDAYDNKASTIQVIPYYNHPEIGLIPFNDFNKIAEECGRIDEIWQWTMQHAIQQFLHWETKGYKPDNIMVNVTISQLENIEFVIKMNEIFDKTKFDKNRIIFDISDACVASNNQAFKKSLHTIQEMGVQISISTMALGKLALHNILDFPVNYLKIDEKLVKGLIMNMDNEAIITSLIAVCNNSNIKVIADGVDIDNLKNKLLDLGCSLMKGKIFTQPVTASELYDMEISKLHVNNQIS